jgi:hypothetical protein
MSFGFKIREDDVGPPRCRVRFSSSTPSESTCTRDASEITECVYGLRYVERTSSSKPLDQWRVRQTAVYQKIDTINEHETWLFVSAPKSMEDRIQRHLIRSRSPEPVHPQALHLELISIALKNYRWYIKSLTAKVTEEVSWLH